MDSDDSKNSSAIAFDGFSKGDAAALRRGVDPWEVGGFYELFKIWPDLNKNMLAIAAPVLAEIRESDGEKFGRKCHGIVSEKRLRRLLGARDRVDLVRQLSSVVRITGRSANPQEIVDIVCFWGPRQRRRLAQDYFGVVADD